WPPAPLRTPADETRSPPARCETHGSSPENRCARQTRCCRLKASGQDPPYDTSELPDLPRTDAAKTSPPSAPDGSSSPAPRPLRRYTTHPSRRLEPADLEHRVYKSEDPGCGGRSGCL